MGFYQKMTEIYQEKKIRILENQCINRKRGMLKLTNQIKI